MSIPDILNNQATMQVSCALKRPDIFQVFIPFFHEDGDMVEVFAQELRDQPGKIRISDFGMTIQRLSYTLNDPCTPARAGVMEKILAENRLSEDGGNIFMDVDEASLFPSLMQFSQTVGKVSSMRFYRREVIRSMFYDMLYEYILGELQEFKPIRQFVPIEGRDELEVDCRFDIGPRPVFLFGVRDEAKARLAALCCHEFRRNSVRFQSCIVHEDFESLGKKDRLRLLSATEKQFPDLGDFKTNAREFLAGLAA